MLREKTTRDNTTQDVKAVPCFYPKTRKAFNSTIHLLTMLEAASSYMQKTWFRQGLIFQFIPTTLFPEWRLLCWFDAQAESHVRILIARLPLTWDYRVRQYLNSHNRFHSHYLGVPLSRHGISWHCQAGTKLTHRRMSTKPPTSSAAMRPVHNLINTRDKKCAER